jgi:outer membrane immunogenic protein
MLGLVLSFIAAPALAADLAPAMPVKAPPVIIPTWAGFYIGGNVGGVWEKDNGASDFTQAEPLQNLRNNPIAGSTTSTAAIGGLHAGYNWQIRQWVLGLEGDWDWTNTKSSSCRQTDLASAPCSDNDRGFLTLGSGTDWIATVRGRLGYTWDRFMVYGTGGAAFGKVDTTINANCLVDGCGFSATVQNATAAFSDTKAGWVAGAGVEAMLSPNWIARVEYLHIDLGTVNHTLGIITNDNGTESAPWSRSVRFDEVRGGISYKF